MLLFYEPAEYHKIVLKFVGVSVFLIGLAVDRLLKILSTQVISGQFGDISVIQRCI
jgi:hypothetical protein